MNTRDQAPPAADATIESLDAQLRFAIANKRLLELRYEGYRRIVEPHDYGVQHGVTRVLIYQRCKFGADRRSTGWRLLDIAKILECAVLDQTFSGTRAHANQRHHAWDTVHARVT